MEGVPKSSVDIHQGWAKAVCAVGRPKSPEGKKKCIGKRVRSSKSQPRCSGLRGRDQDTGIAELMQVPRITES